MASEQNKIALPEGDARENTRRFDNVNFASEMPRILGYNHNKIIVLKTDMRRL